jgi:hypothetical protein
MDIEIIKREDEKFSRVIKEAD